MYITSYRFSRLDMNRRIRDETANATCIIEQNELDLYNWLGIDKLVLYSYLTTCQYHRPNRLYTTSQPTYKFPLTSSPASQAFSPWIVATTLLVCLLALNSKYQIPCQVPVFNRPLVIGIFTEAPTRADLIWACHHWPHSPKDIK